MKRVIILHSYGGGTRESFGPYILEESKKRNLDCYFPQFPTREDATFENWTKVMDTYLKEGLLDKETIVIAHSMGTHFFVKYVGLRDCKVGTYISVAGMANLNSNIEYLNEAVKKFNPEVEDYMKTIENTKDIYSIYSDNDHLSPQEELIAYANMLNATHIMVPGAGHFTGKRDNVKKIEQIFEIIDGKEKYKNA